MTDAPSQHEWVRLVAAADIPPGRAKFIIANGLELAAFHLSNPDRFVVSKNSCPHAGGNLSAGRIETNQVTCPWHEWTFDLDSGSCPLSESVRLQQFKIRMESGDLFAWLPRQS